MDERDQKKTAVCPKSVGQGCAYLIALAIVASIEFVEAVPYHVRYYLWCAWYYTGGQVRLLFMSWRLSLEQQRIRRANPSYHKLDR